MGWHAFVPIELRDQAFAAGEEFAWNRETALQVLAILDENQCRILGVDVWRAAPGGPEVLPYYMDMSGEPADEAMRQAIWFVRGFNWEPEDPDPEYEPLFNITAEFLGSDTRH